MSGNVEVRGLRELVAELKGPMFKDLNKQLRAHSKVIANDIKPFVEDAVRRSNAPQARAMARTVRVHSDRVPVVAVGKVNPPFTRKVTGATWNDEKGRFKYTRVSAFTRPGESAGDRKRRRGAMAHGVLAGPKSTPNVYKIPRDNSYGPLGRALREGGPIMRKAEADYLKFFMQTLKGKGWQVKR